MKKVFVYRRGKVVEQGSSEDWEEDLEVRFKKEWEELSQEERDFVEDGGPRGLDRYYEMITRKNNFEYRQWSLG